MKTKCDKKRNCMDLRKFKWNLSLNNNSIRISSGVDYMTNGNDKNSVQIIGGKLGCDWDILTICI